MKVLVVGGGIAGLSAAHALGKAGVPTLLLERSDRLGGKVATERTDGFVIELGPDSFVSYRPAAVALARELGLGDELIRPQEPRTVYIQAGGRFRRFPDGMGLVLPTKFKPFILSDLFTPLQKARMGLDLVLPRDPDRGDVGVGPFLRRRLGPALVARLAGPLIGGVYGTDIDELSLDAVVPQLRASEARHRSLLVASWVEARERAAARRAAVAAGKPAPPPPSPFVSLRGGTGQLVEALAAAVAALPSVEIRLGAAVTAVELEGSAPVAVLAGGERVPGEAAILAGPAPVTAAQLEGLAPAAAAALGAIRHGSTAVVNLAYRAADVPDTVLGHGYLVADDEPTTINAATLSSRKWAGRAPGDDLLVRAFIGDARSAAHVHDDAALARAAHADIAAALGLRADPILTRVSRYPDAMPKYTVGHLDRVAAAEAALGAFPQLRLAGGAYRGVGLPDCIAQGRAAAEAILARADAPAGGGDPDPAAPTAPTAPAGSLGGLTAGTPARIVSVPADHAEELALEGLRPGTEVAVLSRAPLGGPVVVGVGRARVAVSKPLATAIGVAPVPVPVDPAS